MIVVGDFDWLDQLEKDKPVADSIFPGLKLISKKELRANRERCISPLPARRATLSLRERLRAGLPLLDSPLANDSVILDFVDPEDAASRSNQSDYKQWQLAIDACRRYRAIPTTIREGDTGWQDVVDYFYRDLRTHLDRLSTAASQRLDSLDHVLTASTEWAGRAIFIQCKSLSDYSMPWLDYSVIPDGRCPWPIYRFSTTSVIDSTYLRYFIQAARLVRELSEISELFQRSRSTLLWLAHLKKTVVGYLAKRTKSLKGINRERKWYLYHGEHPPHSVASAIGSSSLASFTRACSIPSVA